MDYCKIEAQDLAELRRRCSRVLTGEEINEDYARDEMPIYGIYPPEALVCPENVQEVSQVAAYCHERRIPITVRGAGTGLCGGAVPVLGGLLLSTERLNRIIEIDEENMTVTVEPGMRLNELQAKVLERGLFYPPEPGEKNASIGGNVMTNAGGMKAVKYGVTRDYVMALEVVLPDGQILNLGGKVAKNASGYSLLHLFIGSEGTLGMVTKITLRLIAKPTATASILLPFPDLSTCINTVPLLLKSSLKPTAVEFMQRAVIAEAERHLDRAFPDKTGEAYLLVSFDGADQSEIERLSEQAVDLALEAGALDALYADTTERITALWEARSCLLEAIKEESGGMDECDVVVPRSHIVEFVDYIDRLEAELQVRIRYFGHAADGNIHIYVCRDKLGEEEWNKRLKSAMEAMYKKAVELEGKVSGEHGIGHAKRDFLLESEGPLFVELLRGIKKVFDPENLLNPGKVV